MIDKVYWAVFKDDNFLFEEDKQLYWSKTFDPSCFFDHELAEKLSKCYKGSILKNFRVQECEPSIGVLKG